MCFCKAAKDGRPSPPKPWECARTAAPLANKDFLGDVVQKFGRKQHDFAFLYVRYIQDTAAAA